MINFSAIVACDLAGCFSQDGKIPWHYPEDLDRFKQITMGKICVMGRNTFDDLKTYRGDVAEGEPILPGRETYVVTTRPGLNGNAHQLSSIYELRTTLPCNDTPHEVVMCGGSSIYKHALSLCDTIYLTCVNRTITTGERLYFPVYEMDRHFKVVQALQSVTNPGELGYFTFRRKQ